MIYSPIGKFLNENLQNVAEHYPYAEIPVFQVMPNHVHVIVFIDKPVDTVMGSGADNINNAERPINNETNTDNINNAERPVNNGVDLYCGDCRDAARHVSTSDATANAPSDATATQPFNAPIPTVTNKNEKMRDIAVNRGRLSTVIGGLKSATTKFANDNKIPFGWQERFHDHIIRDVDELNRIATYIENNPRNWKGDTFYL